MLRQSHLGASEIVHEAKTELKIDFEDGSIATLYLSSRSGLRALPPRRASMTARPHGIGYLLCPRIGPGGFG
jgi:hypothetical protein